MKMTRQSSRHSMSALPSRKPVNASSSPKTLPSSMLSSTVQLPSACRRRKRRAAREQHADHILLLPTGEDGLSCAEALLVCAEAAQHIFARYFVHACKQRGIAAVHRFPSRKACCFTGAAQPLTYCIIIYQRGKKVNDNFAKKSDKKACDPCKKASALFGGCFVLGFARIVVKHLRNGR